MNIQTVILGSFLMIAVAYAVPAYGHGFGFDSINSVSIDGREVTITVEMPEIFDGTDGKVVVTAIDEDTRETLDDVTFLLGLYHEDQMIFRNYFLAPEGILDISLVNEDAESIEFEGVQEPPLDAWRAPDSGDLTVRGPVFDSGGLYNFEIQLRTIDSTDNVIDDQTTHRADVSVVETDTFVRTDPDAGQIPFGTKSYFDSIQNFEYDPDGRQIRFEMPFDWDRQTISHIPVVHEEVHFPKEFSQSFGPGYSGRVNGVDLFRSSLAVDDYTDKNDRIVHFVLLADHLKFIRAQMEKDGRAIPEIMEFELTAMDRLDFPVNAMTANEEFQIDLSWDPAEIIPGAATKFVFTIRDGATGEPMRHSSYDFVILQNDIEVYRTSGNAAVGGAFEQYEFAEGQTGQTTVRFENIRGSGLDTEFSIVVVPEFGLISAVLVIAILAVIIAGRLKSTHIAYPLYKK